MKNSAIAFLLTAAACAAPAPADRDTLTTASEARAWLRQLVGEWRASAEAVVEPGGEPSRWESTESVRTLGEPWIVAEGSAVHEGTPFASMLTLGFDPAESAFVGSWVDSIQTKMWTYRGTLDETGRVLTLSAEGPSWSDPSVMAEYRDQLELVDANHKRMISFVLDEDGEWQQYLTVNYRRKSTK